jgi:hypothetical protein
MLLLAQTGDWFSVAYYPVKNWREIWSSRWCVWLCALEWVGLRCDHLWALVGRLMRTVGVCLDTTMCGYVVHGTFILIDKYILPWPWRQYITPKRRQLCNPIASCHIPEGCALYRPCPQASTSWRYEAPHYCHLQGQVVLKWSKLLTHWHIARFQKTWMFSTAVGPVVWFGHCFPLECLAPLVWFTFPGFSPSTSCLAVDFLPCIAIT